MARSAAASAREKRLEEARARLPEPAKIKLRHGQDPATARSSTTDPDATIRKMADGGFRPAFNVPCATDTESQIIVGVEVVTARIDQGQLSPMVEQVCARRCALRRAANGDAGQRCRAGTRGVAKAAGRSGGQEFDLMR